MAEEELLETLIRVNYRNPTIQETIDTIVVEHLEKNPMLKGNISYESIVRVKILEICNSVINNLVELNEEFRRALIDSELNGKGNI